MKIETLTLGKLGVNCYLILSSMAAVVIDPAINDKRIEDFLLKNDDKERLILLTHCHFDHIGGAEILRHNTGVKIAIGENEAPSLLDSEITLSNRFHAHIAPFNADILLKDGQTLKIGDLEFLCTETKGHTAGGMCYKVGSALFSGDTLFKLSVGRVDFPGSSAEDLIASLSKINNMFKDAEVYPGHGEATTLEYERRYNPYLKSNGEYLL